MLLDLDHKAISKNPKDQYNTIHILFDHKNIADLPRQDGHKNPPHLQEHNSLMPFDK
jgi:hypothetical protein